MCIHIKVLFVCSAAAAWNVLCYGIIWISFCPTSKSSRQGDYVQHRTHNANAKHESHTIPSTGATTNSSPLPIHSILEYHQTHALNQYEKQHVLARHIYIGEYAQSSDTFLFAAWACCLCTPRNVIWCGCFICVCVCVFWVWIRTSWVTTTAHNNAHIVNAILRWKEEETKSNDSQNITSTAPKCYAHGFILAQQSQ